MMSPTQSIVCPNIQLDIASLTSTFVLTNTIMTRHIGQVSGCYHKLCMLMLGVCVFGQCDSSSQIRTLKYKMSDWEDLIGHIMIWPYIPIMPI